MAVDYKEADSVHAVVLASANRVVLQLWLAETPIAWIKLSPKQLDALTLLLQAEKARLAALREEGEG